MGLLNEKRFVFTVLELASSSKPMFLIAKRLAPNFSDIAIIFSLLLMDGCFPGSNCGGSKRGGGTIWSGRFCRDVVNTTTMNLGWGGRGEGRWVGFLPHLVKELGEARQSSVYPREKIWGERQAESRCLQRLARVFLGLAPNRLWWQVVVDAARLVEPEDRLLLSLA